MKQESSRWPISKKVRRFLHRDVVAVVEFVELRHARGALVVSEDHKVVNGLWLIHLPGGPTAHFKLSSLKLSRDIKGHGNPTSHRPELILNNFNTRLGKRMGRMIASLFPLDPQFKGRRVVTCHNQRDFLFFRHHRYIFEEGKRKNDGPVRARLQELGPQFLHNPRFRHFCNRKPPTAVIFRPWRGGKL